MKKFIRHYLNAIFIWNPLVCAFIELGLGNYKIIGPSFLISMIIATVTATVCILGTEILRKPLQKRFSSFKKLELLITMVLITPGLLLGNFIAEPVVRNVYGESNSFTMFSGYFYAGLIILVAYSSYSYFEFKKAKRDFAIKMQKLEIENLKAKVSSLTNQMNPHFLFNSLNSIASIIHDDPEAAEEMVVKLANVYRGVLLASTKESQSLKDELELCESFLEIEKIRFKERLNYNFSVPADLDTGKVKIPVLMIQTLIENSLKHGIAPKVDGGIVSISVERKGQNLVVSVIDNGLGVNAPQNNTSKISLVNCRERLSIIFKGEETFTTNIHENGSEVSFEYPIQERLDVEA